MRELLRVTAALLAAVWMTAPAAFGAEAGTDTAVTRESARMTASGLVPDDGVFQYTEQCGDAYEVVYYSEEERSYYTIRVSVFTGEVASISVSLLDSRGSREAVLTEEEAGAIASEDAGEVWVESVALVTVAGRKRYDVKCVGDGLEADYQINPESGRIIKKTIQYL